MTGDACDSGRSFVWESGIRIKKCFVSFMIKEDQAPSTGGVKRNGSYLFGGLRFAVPGISERAHREGQRNKQQEPIKSRNHQFDSHHAPHNIYDPKPAGE